MMESLNLCGVATGQVFNLDNVAGKCFPNQGEQVFCFELSHQISTVGLDGRFADFQFVGYFLISIAICQLNEDFLLPFVESGHRPGQLSHDASAVGQVLGHPQRQPLGQGEIFFGVNGGQLGQWLAFQVYQGDNANDQENDDYPADSMARLSSNHGMSSFVK